MVRDLSNHSFLMKHLLITLNELYALYKGQPCLPGVGGSTVVVVVVGHGGERGTGNRGPRCSRRFSRLIIRVFVYVEARTDVSIQENATPARKPKLKNND